MISIQSERHAGLHSLARTIYQMPGTRSLARFATRTAIQYSPLNLRNKQRLYNFFAADTVPERPAAFTVRLPQGHQLRLQLDLHDDLSRQWYYWGYTGYEREVTRLLCELLPTKACVFDIGANIGFHTLLIAKLLQCRGSIYAFEPWSEVFNWLALNVQQNDLNWVHTNQCALSDSDGEAELLLPADSAYTNASLLPDFTNQEHAMPIRTQRFDSYCREHAITRVDLVKLDVEGAELQVLRGMGELLNEWQPDIICEVLEPYAAQLDVFFQHTPYRKFLITPTGLQEQRQIVAHTQYRDYYLSCAPITRNR